MADPVSGEVERDGRGKTEDDQQDDETNAEEMVAELLGSDDAPPCARDAHLARLPLLGDVAHVDLVSLVRRRCSTHRFRPSGVGSLDGSASAGPVVPVVLAGCVVVAAREFRAHRANRPRRSIPSLSASRCSDAPRPSDGSAVEMRPRPGSSA